MPILLLWSCQQYYIIVVVINENMRSRSHIRLLMRLHNTHANVFCNLFLKRMFYMTGKRFKDSNGLREQRGGEGEVMVVMEATV
jgi:hypothetical protein